METPKQIRHVIVVLVRPNKMKQYEAWLEKVRDTIVNFEGFIAMDVVREKEAAGVSYVIINRFVSHEDYLRWNHSKELKSLLLESRSFIIFKKVDVQKVGVDMYFDRPNSVDALVNPPMYKKIIIGILAVYPIVLIGSYTIVPLVDKLGLDNWLSILLSTCVISPLIGWFLPVVSRVFAGWLYKKR